MKYTSFVLQSIVVTLLLLARTADVVDDSSSEPTLTEQTLDFILPMLRPLVDAKVFNCGFVDKAVFDQIKLRGRTWSFYGQLVLERIQEASAWILSFLNILPK